MIIWSEVFILYNEFAEQFFRFVDHKIKKTSRQETLTQYYMRNL